MRPVLIAVVTGTKFQFSVCDTLHHMEGDSQNLARRGWAQTSTRAPGYCWPSTSEPNRRPRWDGRSRPHRRWRRRLREWPCRRPRRRQWTIGTPRMLTNGHADVLADGNVRSGRLCITGRAQGNQQGGARDQILPKQARRRISKSKSPRSFGHWEVEGGGWQQRSHK